MTKSEQQDRAVGRAGRHQRHVPRALQPAQRARRPGALNSPPRPQPEARIAYSDDLAAQLCEHVADGLSLKEACELPGMPKRRTAYKWLGEHENFMRMYTRAREERADLVADEIITIADTERDPNKAKVMIDARKWWAARVNPKKYGEKIISENTNHNYMISDKPMTEDEWEAEHGLGTAIGASTRTH
jgi:hypothetical protein